MTLPQNFIKQYVPRSMRREVSPVQGLQANTVQESKSPRHVNGHVNGHTNGHVNTRIDQPREIHISGNDAENNSFLTHRSLPKESPPMHEDGFERKWIKCGNGYVPIPVDIDEACRVSMLNRMSNLDCWSYCNGFRYIRCGIYGPHDMINFAPKSIRFLFYSVKNQDKNQPSNQPNNQPNNPQIYHTAVDLDNAIVRNAFFSKFESGDLADSKQTIAGPSVKSTLSVLVNDFFWRLY